MSYTMEQVCPVLFGAGAIEEIGQKIADFGAKKVMMVCDPGVKACGIGPRIEKLIKDAGFELLVYDEVLSDPPHTMVDEIVDWARKEEIDLVVGVGGGSSMDTGKAIGFMMKHPGSIRDWMQMETDFASVPIICVPTNAGTGSESTQFCVITDTINNFKGGIFIKAALAIVDPELTVSAPPSVTAFCGLDAFAHAAEALTTNLESEKCDVLAAASLSKIMKYLPICMEDPGNIEARTQMALASNFAGQAFQECNVHFGHGVAEPVGAWIHEPHGLVCAWATPATCEYLGDCADIKYIKKIADPIGVDYSDIEDDGPAIGQRCAEAVRELMRVCKVPSYADRGHSREEVMGALPDVASSFHMDFCPTEITYEMAEKYLASTYDNYSL
ncbi:MAG: iron-containing alcohol dehydrogenase [bacterium]|nr:iron-containing alcohol dehydrogenase [bacterium]